MGKLNLQVKVHWGSLRKRHRWLASFMTSSEMPFMGLSWFLWESRLRLRFASRWFRLCRWVSACHAKLGKRDLSLYSQCDTHATMSPNCRDSVAWVSFRGDIASQCCRLSRMAAPLIDQNRRKNFGQSLVLARIDQKIGCFFGLFVRYATIDQIITDIFGLFGMVSHVVKISGPKNPISYLRK